MAAVNKAAKPANTSQGHWRSNKRNRRVREVAATLCVSIRIGHDTPRIDAERRGYWAGRDARIVVMARAQVTLHGDALHLRIERRERFFARALAGEKIEQAREKSGLLLLDGVHADVAVRAALGTGAAADAVLLDDFDLAARQSHDAVDAAHQTRRIAAMAASRREHVRVDLNAAQLQPAVAVASTASVDAIAAAGAAGLVDHEHLATAGEPRFHQHAFGHR